mmetsp:Transcript_19837/g.38536  ORF Transcript_19837/g.38536 Transcript_19837/m.38536 type:complete len:251 (-) Transcript_19837:156-908(-)
MWRRTQSVVPSSPSHPPSRIEKSKPERNIMQKIMTAPPSLGGVGSGARWRDGREPKGRAARLVRFDRARPDHLQRMQAVQQRLLTLGAKLFGLAQDLHRLHHDAHVVQLLSRVLGGGARIARYAACCERDPRLWRDVQSLVSLHPGGLIGLGGCPPGAVKLALQDAILHPLLRLDARRPQKVVACRRVCLGPQEEPPVLCWLPLCLACLDTPHNREQRPRPAPSPFSSSSCVFFRWTMSAVPRFREICVR